jgi:hypothetical protein
MSMPGKIPADDVVMSFLRLVPKPMKSLESEESVVAHLLTNHDFMVVDMGSDKYGKQVCLADMRRAGIGFVHIFYGEPTKGVQVILSEDKPVVQSIKIFYHALKKA